MALSLPKHLYPKFLRQEYEWLKKETEVFDKVPVIKDIGKGKIIRWAIKIGLAFSLLVVFFIHFHKIFITILFILIVSYIRFKRVKMGLHFEIEPSYLLGLGLAFAFGLEYAILYAALPLAALIFNEGIGPVSVISLGKKVFIFASSLFFFSLVKNPYFLYLFATFIVVVTDLLDFILRKKMGQPMHMIFQGTIINSIIRLAYFALFLEQIVTRVIPAI